MAEQTFSTTDVNKVITWFGMPSEIQAEFILTIDKVEDRNDALLATCLEAFEQLLTYYKIQVDEDLRFGMFARLVFTLCKYTCKMTLPDYNNLDMLALLLALKLETQKETK